MALKGTFDADFGQFVAELTKVDVKLREFEPAADRASARLQRMADSLNGNKLLEQAAVAVGAIGRIEGGVAALNNGELRRYGTLIDAATEKLTRQGREVPPALAQVKAALDQARQPLDAIKTSATAASGALGGIAGAIGQGLGIGAGVGVFGLITQGVAGLKDEIVATIQEGNKLSQLRTAFASLQGGPGPAAIAIADLRQATRGLVSDIDLLSAANKASLLGLGEMGIKTDELASIAVRLGKAMGQDAAKSVDDLTTALARQSPQILDNLGIKVDLTAANERFASGLGKSVTALSEEEKKLAFATAAMDAARSKADTLGEAQLTLSEQVSRVGNALDNMQAGLGASVNESGVLSDAVGGLAGRLDGLVDSTGAAAESFGDALGPLGDFVGRLDSLPEVSQGVADGLGLVVIPALGALTLALKGSAEQFDRLKLLRQSFSGALDVLDTPTLPGASRRSDIQLGGSFGQGKRAQDALAAEQKRLEEAYIKAQDDALRRLETGRAQAVEQATARIVAARRKEQEATDRLIADLTGADLIGKATETADAVLKIGTTKIPTAHLEKVALELIRGRALADQTTGSYRKMGEALNSIAITSSRIEGLNPLFIQGSINAASQAAMRSKDAFQYGNNPLEGANTPTAGMLIGLAPALEPTRVKVTQVAEATRSWSASMQAVGQAFANLSQVSGGLDPITRQVGLFVTSLGAAEQLVTSVGQSFNKDFAFGDSKAGQTAASGLAGGLMGWQVGTGSGLSPWRAAGLGAITGGAAGIPYAKATSGASIAVGAVVGATTAYFGAQKAQSELRKAKDLQAETLVAQYGTLDVLLETVGALGLNQQTFLERYYGEPKEFAKGVTDLNNALTREKNTVDALATSLNKVTKAQGVLGQGDRAKLGLVRAGGPGEELAEQFKGQQTDSLLGGLDRILQQKGPLSASLVKGVGQSLRAALSALEQQGASPLEALKTLMPLLDQFREKAVLAGAGSTPGFDALNNQLAILKDDRLGPLIERASGAGQSLAALNNLNLLDDQTFSGFAASITESVAGMDLLSVQGQSAMRLIRGPLQNVWQLQKDFGYETDEATQKLLDQAGAAGLIGDKFRPAEEKLLLGIDRVVDRLDTLVDVFTNDLVTDAGTGADAAGRNILAAFEKVRPRIKIEYEYDTPSAGLPPPGPEDPDRRTTGRGSQAAKTATASQRGGDVYLDGERVGYHTLRHAGDFADLIGA